MNLQLHLTSMLFTGFFTMYNIPKSVILSCNNVDFNNFIKLVFHYFFVQLLILAGWARVIWVGRSPHLAQHPGAATRASQNGKH